MVGFKKSFIGELISAATNLNNGVDLSAAAASALSKIQGTLASSTIENADRLFEAQYRSAFNPRKEMLFNEPVNRTLSLAYEFAPRNEEETRAINDIMNLFKIYSSPERKNEGRSLYRYPAEYQLYFISNEQENPFIAKLARVALTSIETSYSGTGVVSMLKNSSPSKIKVTMSFSETELLDRRHYSESKDVEGQ